MAEDGINSFMTGPDEAGRFGIFGGRFVSETLMPLILDLEERYEFAKTDPSFWAEMDWLWFSLYKARLMTVNGRYQQGQYPLLLDIEYYRDIDAADLLEATADQWRHLGYADSDIGRWLNLLKGIWPDVTPGDHLSFKIIDANQSQFYFICHFLVSTF